jgi:ABC-type uncharacterized transport system ATPase subunit
MKHGDAAASDAAFATAAHIVKLDLVNQRLAPASMEPRCSLASKVKRDRVILTCKALLDELPVSDIDIQEVPIEDVIRQIFAR